MSCTRAWNCMRGPRLVYTCLADHLHAVFCGAFKGSATKRKNSCTPETPRPGIFLTQLFPTRPIRLLLCRHNMDRHYTEVCSFPAADAASNCGEPEVCNEWREVCFDRQRDKAYLNKNFPTGPIATRFPTFPSDSAQLPYKAGIATIRKSVATSFL